MQQPRTTGEVGFENVSDKLLSSSDRRLYIEMDTGVDSLNVSNAVSIIGALDFAVRNRAVASNSAIIP